MDTKAYERLTGGVRSITTDHGYIHDGIGFSCSKTKTIAGSATLDCIFKTPAASDGYVHLRPAVIASSASAVIVGFYEGPTYTGGQSVASFNRNRNSSRASAVTILDVDVSVSATGTALTENYIGTGGNPSSVAGGSLPGAEDEIVLKPDTAYLIRFANQTATDTVVDVDLFWYEESMGS